MVEMSERNYVNLQPVTVHPIVKDTIERLQRVKFGDEELTIFTMRDIIREALYKGLRLMCLERKLAEEMLGAIAVQGAEIQASLLKEKEEDSS